MWDNPDVDSLTRTSMVQPVESPQPAWRSKRHVRRQGTVNHHPTTCGRYHRVSTIADVKDSTAGMTDIKTELQTS